jgi:predicted nucleotidyltransferase
MVPLAIRRQGSYHDVLPDEENPSATAVRHLIISGGDWRRYVPGEVFAGAAVHSLQSGERAILAKLRSMTDGEFEALPYGSEGLWRKFMAACRSCATVEEIMTATKSKRYTRSRLDRMLMCAFLGITQEMLEKAAPYTRVLAMNDRGREILKKARLAGEFPHTGEKMDDLDWNLEQPCSDLYGLFCDGVPEKPGLESKRRILYIK